MAVPQSGRAIVADFLAQFGLSELADWAWGQYKQLGGGAAALNQIQIDMVNQSAFKARFPAYDELAKRGHAMSPAAMLSYEATARQIFHDAGLPLSFYDQPDDIAKFLVNDVSSAELQSRVQRAQTAVAGAPDTVRTELQRLYGIDPGHLTAYFLDPTKAQPLLERQFNAAQLGGAAQRSGFGALSVAQAEALAAQGVTDQAAVSGFGDLAASQGLFEVQTTGETAIDRQTQINAQFSNDAAARERIRRRQEARAAQFSGSSGFGIGQRGVSGLGSSDQSAF